MSRQRPEPPLRGFVRQAALLAGVFTAVGGIAKLAGATNLGTALSFAQIAFVIALVALLLRS